MTISNQQRCRVVALVLTMLGVAQQSPGQQLTIGILLEQLRQEALVPLVEMARWKSPGHALPALMILGRIAGLSDEVAASASTPAEREAVIKAALDRK